MTKRKVRLDRPASCRFDEQAARRAVRFFREELRHTKGRRHAGKPFGLTPEQEHDLREIFGRMDADGNRLIRQVFKAVPKKNGKSEEAAGVANKLLFADDEPGAEVYGAAADITQAGIVFGVAASMVRHNPKLLRRSKIWDSTKRIVVPGSESYYRAVTSKVAGKHGFNSHGVIFDEVHTQATMDLWDVLTFGAGSARSQPLTYAITTAGIPGESPVAEMLWDEADQILRGITPCPDHFYPIIYAAEDDDPWDDEEVWYECNPFLRDGIMRIEDVRIEFDDARRRPEQQNTFRRLRLNQWTKTAIRAIDMDQWDCCSGQVELNELKHLTWYAGLDLSTKLDITALVLCAIDGNGVAHYLPHFWLPKDSIQDRAHQETAKYRQWSQQELITLTEGNVVDYSSVRRRFKELGDAGLNIAQVGFDPWNATQLAQEMQEDGCEMVEIRQGYRSLSEPTKGFLSDVVQGNMRHGGNPVLRWMADCLSIRQDENANIRPVKPDRMKSGKRIDGIVAAIMARSRAVLGEDNAISYMGGFKSVG